MSLVLSELCRDTTLMKVNQNQPNVRHLTLQASEKERYSIEELLSDLSTCQARQVYVIADQSYSGVIVRAIRRSKHHHNVAVFASSKDHEYSFGNEFSQLLTSFNHTHGCMQDIHKASIVTLHI